MKLLLLALSSLALASCGNNNPQARTPVPPKGSDDAGYMPWNDPGQGARPGGPLADMMEGR